MKEEGETWLPLTVPYWYAEVEASREVQIHRFEGAHMLAGAKIVHGPNTVGRSSVVVAKDELAGKWEYGDVLE